ncbi:MAG: MarR family transcriptional regulator [Gammaproteobacteria bacterium]|nr:MarR family transcriptional regulator [Gammaproteobacteria bacterium]
MNKKLSEEAVQAWIQLHHAHRLLLERVEKALKDTGLPPLGWYDVLLELHREKSTGLRQYEIGEKILLDKHNLSRLIDRLEKNHLVARHACVEDGRGNRIKITGEGVKMMKKIWPVYSRSIQENFGVKLASSEFLELQRTLKKILV